MIKDSEPSDFPFEILIDDVKGINCSAFYDPSASKYVLSLLNDFEQGKWRSINFHKFIWDNIAETSLSHQERDALVDRAQSRLIAAAKNLRLTDEDKIGKGSEVAEIVLYGLMKHYYKALSVVPKIFYKQNPKDNAKGADSVHILTEQSGEFSLWLGEAKFYNGIEDCRFDPVIKSITEMLSAEKLRKENSLITNLSDLDKCVPNKSVLTNIKRALSSDRSLDSTIERLNVPILLLHECDKTESVKSIDDSYKEWIHTFHSERAASFFRKKAKSLGSMYNVHKIKFHLIFLPVPSKQDIVNKFVKTSEFYQNYDND